ncbi:MAG: hypothetical protein ICV56_06610 [Nitrososphaeraceae archaeon]|nr:hypothetical protein [Nitrososphaeraceae archaeon]
MADNLKFTASMNEKLVDLYKNYPSDPQGFQDWQRHLNGYLIEAFMKLK